MVHMIKPIAETTNAGDRGIDSVQGMTRGTLRGAVHGLDPQQPESQP